MQTVLQNEYTLTQAQMFACGVCRPDAVMTLLQDAAVAHANALGVGRACMREHRNCVWMLVRSRYCLRRPLRAGDSVRVDTWAYRTDGLTNDRDFALYCGGEQVGEASQVWALVDGQRRKIVRIRDFPEIQAMSVVDSDVPVKLRRLVMPALQPAGEYLVAQEDTDINGHMNNAAYLKCVMLPLGAGVGDELQINYERECRAGDRLPLPAAETNGWQYVRGVNDDQQTSFEARVHMA